MFCPVCNAQNPESATACRTCGAPLSATPTAALNALPAGTKLRGGMFSIGRVLGRGGFGITYLGSDTRLHRSVAIKEFFPADCVRQSNTVVPARRWTAEAYGDAKQRFLREGQTLARFNHPGVVQVFEAFEENNTAYIVMEYLSGKSLAAVLQEHGGRLSEQEAVGYIEKVGAALEVVHGTNLLHRDIKPENVMVCADGRVVLIDFGTAKEYAAGKTQTQSTTLTPGYAPLEQYGPKARRGPFTDVYALAATLYHLLTGQVPIPATDRAVGVELPTVQQFNSQVSKGTAQGVMRGLEMKVENRPQSVRAFLDLLKGKAPGTVLPPQPIRTSLTLTGHSGWVTSVAFSPDGRTLASGGLDGTVKLWDVQTGALQRTLVERGNPVWSVIFSPDGRIFASGNDDGTIRLWDAQTGMLKGTLTEHSDSVFSIAFSPDSKTFASGSRYTVKLWNVQTRALWRTLTDPGHSVRSVAFSPDGKIVGGGSEDGTVKLWDMQTGALQRGLTGHSRCVFSVAFSPDGKTVASGSNDQTVRMWDSQTGALKWSLTGHNGRVVSVAFSPDGKTVASGSGDKTVRLWRFE